MPSTFVRLGLALLLPLAVVPVPGCNGEGCNDIGCDPEARINLSREVPVYEVTVVVGAASLSARCPADALLAGGFRITCNPRAMHISGPGLLGDSIRRGPVQAQLELVIPGAAPVRTSAALAHRGTANGLGCEHPCYQAEGLAVVP